MTDEVRSILRVERGNATRFHYGWVITIAAFVISTVAYGVFYSFGIFFPHIVSEQGWSYAEASGAFSVAVVTYGFFGIPMGLAADRYGPRKAVGVGGILFGLGIFLGSQVHEVWHLYVVYGLVAAVGMGAAYVPLVSTVSRWFAAQRGLALGIAGLGSGAGTFLLTPVIGLLIDKVGWREAYVIAGIGSAIILVAASAFLFSEPKSKGLQPYGAEKQATAKAAPKPVARGRDLTLTEAMRTGTFWIVQAAFAIWWLSSLIPYIHGATYARDKGASPAEAAIWLSLLGLGISLGKVLMGAAADHIGTKAAWNISLVVEIAGLLLLVPAHDLHTLWLLAVVTGFGYGGGSPQFTTITAEQFGLSSLGIIYGIFFFGVSVVGALGPVLAGYIHDTVGDYAPAFIGGGAVLVLSVVLNMMLRSPRADPVQPGGLER